MWPLREGNHTSSKQTAQVEICEASVFVSKESKRWSENGIGITSGYEHHASVVETLSCLTSDNSLFMLLFHQHMAVNMVFIGA